MKALESRIGGNKGAAQGVVGSDGEFEGQVFHVSGGAFRVGGALDGFFQDDSNFASRSVCPVPFCNHISGGRLLWR